MRRSSRRAGVAWIVVLLLMSGGLMGCSGSGSSTSGDSDSSGVIDDVPRSRLAQYSPSDVSYDTTYAPQDVDVPPSLKGGLMALARSVKYPDAAKQQGLTGKVWVGLIVAPDGRPTYVQVVEPVHPILDKEAHRAVTNVRFSPGTVAGSPVPVEIVLPITFSIPTLQVSDDL